jgi:hypothetical protein
MFNVIEIQWNEFLQFSNNEKQNFFNKLKTNDFNTQFLVIFKLIYVCMSC